jgi:bacillithiol biosynthesis deacetylase BshB1
MLDLLVFGPHPDDLEIGMAGTIARHVNAGHAVGLCDLTAGEMGSNGTPAIRLQESEAARGVMGARFRENLGWPDRRIGKAPAHLEHAIAAIRRHRPRTLAVPYWSDRHPDHVAASEVLTEAAFNAGLRRYPGEGEPWKAEWLCYYFINDHVAPSFVIDVSEWYATKRAALDCHASQFRQPDATTAATRLNTPLFRQMIESRDAQFGALSGFRWAEGFVVRELQVRSSLMRFPS